MNGCLWTSLLHEAPRAVPLLRLETRDTIFNSFGLSVGTQHE
jgi:hypothetical protein